MFTNTLLVEVPEILALELAVTTALPLSPAIMQRLELAIRGVAAGMSEDVIHEACFPSIEQIGLILHSALRASRSVAKPS